MAAPGLGAQPFYHFDVYRLSDRMAMGINVANGNLVLHAVDLHMAGIAGHDLVIDRWYNSEGNYQTDFGNGWTMGFGRDVNLVFNPDGSKTFHGPGNFSAVFTPSGTPGVYISPPGINADLVTNADSSLTVWYHKSGEKFFFTLGGLLQDDHDRNNNSIAYKYNSTGQLTTIIDSHQHNTMVGYTGAQISSITDWNGRKVTYSYLNGNLQYYHDSASKLTTFGYTGTLLTTITDPGGNVVNIGYDGNRRVTSVTQHLKIGDSTGPTTHYTYNAGVTVKTDPRQHTTQYAYDSSGRVTAVTDPLGHTQQTSYNGNDDVVQSKDAYGNAINSQYSTDGRNNLLSITLPTTAVSTLTYNSPNQLYLSDTYTDLQGNTSKYTYDAPGNQLTSTNALPSANQVTLAYNSNGTVLGATDGNQNHLYNCGTGSQIYAYCFTYTNGDLTGITNPGPLGGETLGVDAYSRVTSHTDGKGQTTTYCYDPMDRIVGISSSNNCPNPDVQRIYDGNGNLKSQTDASGTTTYLYDGLNRLTRKTPPGASTSCGSSICFSYDANNNLASVHDGGGTTRYGYDNANRLTSLTDPAGLVTHFGYDNNNHRTTTSYPDGVTMTETYDASQRLNSIIAKNSSNTVLSSFTYCYRLPVSGCDTNPVSGTDTGLRQRVIDGGGNVTTYMYDQLNRLCDAFIVTNSSPTHHDHYTYDGNSNRTSLNLNGSPVNSCSTMPGGGSTTNYSYNAANELTSGGAVYDTNGNVTTEGMTGLTAVYNNKDQTSSMTPMGQSSDSFTYAGLFQDERLTAGQGPLGTFSYLSSFLGTMSEKVGSGGTNYYIRDNQGQLVEERVWNGTSYDPYYYLFDGLGSVEALADAKGNRPNAYDYDPFGNLIASVETVSNPWKFAGAYADATGMYHMGQRYYDPTLGLWTQRDPIGNFTDPIEWNRYVYVGQNPVNYTDPSGRDAVQCVGGLLTLGGAALTFIGSAFSFSSSELDGPAGVGAGIGLFGAGLGLSGAGLTATSSGC